MAKVKLKWHTEQRKVSELIGWDKNPHVMTDTEKGNLSKSLDKFDYVEVVIINTDNRLIGGHQRRNDFIAKGKHDELIDVRVPNRKLTDKEFEELAIRLNKNRGHDDEGLLKQFFAVDDLKDWGFDEQELNDIFDIEVELKEDNFNLEEELAKIEKPVTKKCDLYLLGNHKLLCGDSTNANDLEKLESLQIASVIYCDPPYNIGLSYHKGIKGNSNKKTYTNNVFSDNMKDADYLEWVKKTIACALLVSKKDVHIFYWCDPKYIGLIQAAFQQSKIKNKSVCFWLKNQFNPVIQMAFNRVIEPCVYGTIGKPRLNTNITNLSEILNQDVSGRNIHESVLDITDLWLAHRDKTNDYVHPTQKPITLHEKPLKRCSAPGDTVVDLFGGSGSTLISCEQLGRKALLIERDPVFCDVIVKRWEALTGKKATKISTNGKKEDNKKCGSKSA
jgi:DNA modification methylase